jgi:capsular polysaccharide biosynthesis protein
MIVHHLEEILNKNIFLSQDENGREISIFKLEKVVLTGENNFYPNTLLFSEKTKKIYNPIQEKTMSLKDVEESKEFNFIKKSISRVENNPVFYFIYNTDNYFHFIYDSLPYLISFKYLKKQIPSLKLLMNFPNSFKKQNYKFVDEFLEVLDIKKEDIIIAEDGVEYEEVFISSSYTHGHDSNAPPRKEIYELYSNISDKINSLYGSLYKNKTYKKIYISRRTWLNSDHSNIGTNYTLRRRMVNEDALVESLKANGFEEVFTENLTTTEKILLFRNADYIVGAIGGGMCNLLFANPLTDSITICSPTFLEVNKRFIYSLNTCRNILLDNNKHTSEQKYKKYMRVISNNGIIGEIEDIEDGHAVLLYSDKKVSGWNSESTFNKIKIPLEELKPLDSGLNSEWECKISEVLESL